MAWLHNVPQHDRTLTSKMGCELCTTPLSRCTHYKAATVSLLTNRSQFPRLIPQFHRFDDLRVDLIINGVRGVTAK